jgi:hypothetical protein
MRRLILALTGAVGLLVASVASGVSNAANANQPQSCPFQSAISVTSQATQQALTDVQIRRLHRMVLSKSADESTVDSWNRLQRHRRGAK